MNFLKKIFPGQKAPKISVNLPIYNTNPAHLRECIESILNQTFSDFELLILNDSPDNAELDAVVAEYKDPRIVYRKNDKNLGISGSRNKLLDMSRGKYVAICDHDDVSMPTRFEKEVAFLDANLRYGAVSSNLYNADMTPQYYGANENVDIKKKFLFHINFLHPACMLRRSVLDKNNIRYEGEFSPSEDYRLYTKLAECTMFKILPDLLVMYRVHEQSTSVLQAAKAAEITEEILFQYRNRFPFSALEQNLNVLREKIDALRPSNCHAVPNLRESGRVKPGDGKIKILITVPCFERICVQTFKSIYDLFIPDGVIAEFRYQAGYTIEQARNNQVSESIAGGFDYTLFVDSDMVLPKDAITRLLDADADFATGWCLQKIPNSRGITTLKSARGEDWLSEAEVVQAGGAIIPIIACGLFCALVRNSVFGDLKEYDDNWFRYVDAKQPDGTWLTVSEDLDFCNKLMSKGKKLVCDTGLRCGHIGVVEF
ncbi:MAG: glycosyltransferase [Rickettsiales bacterium]|nr:glycosyltransferase [Rickettsiales bacterium]